MLHDFRSALRTGRKDLGSSLASFLTLALGIGATTAVFSLISAAMLHPLPWRASDRLVRIFATDSRSNEDDVSMADYRDWQRHLDGFERLALLKVGQASLTGRGVPERVLTGSVESTLLPLLGAEPLAGRNFSREENGPRGAYVALLSWRFWQAHFAGKEALGRRLMLDEKPYTIVGILPRSVDLLAAGDVWIPLAFDDSREDNGRGFHSYFALGRLRPGVTRAAANAELEALARILAREYPKVNTGVSARVVPLSDSVGTAGRPSTQAGVKGALVMLFGAVLCVLLIACGNVAHLFLARGWSRQRETAVRVCLGASQWALIRYSLTETLILSVPAALAGIGLAQAATSALRKLPLVNFPRLEETAVDWRVCLFAASAALMTAIGVGVLPALRAHRIELIATLKQSGGRTTEAPRQRKWRRVFVALQAALTALLLIETGLLLKSFVRASQIKTAFVPDHLLTVYLSLPASRYGYQHPENAGALSTTILSRVRALPGILSAAITTDLPLMGTAGGGGVLIEGQPRPANLWNSPFVLFTAVSNRYFQTLQTPLLAGTDFHEGAPGRNAVIVNASFARRFFGTEHALGRHVAALDDHPQWKEIIGISADVPQNDIEAGTLPEMFLPLTSTDSPWLGLAIRLSGEPFGYVNSIRSEVARVDPAVALFLPRTMDQIVERQYAWRRLETGVVLSFSLLAIALASVGIYAVIAYSTNQRSSEIGLRMAVGASSREVLLMIMRHGLVPALLGIGAGMAGGYLLARASQRLLFNVATSDLSTYLSVAALLLVVASVAAYLPARRAIRMDPWTALRDE